jgi:hypothetical protein
MYYLDELRFQRVNNIITEHFRIVHFKHGIYTSFVHQNETEWDAGIGTISVCARPRRLKKVLANNENM